MKEGIKVIGSIDVFFLLLDFAMLIVTVAGVRNFVIPEKSKYWLLLIRIFCVDALRSIAFLLLMKF